MHIRLVVASWLLWAGVATAISPQASSPEGSAKSQNGAPAATVGTAASPAQLFQLGQDALNQGRLDEAEHDFQRVLAANPEIGGAYANLGVVYMRRKQWAKALETLRKAEHLLPEVAGIRLNIGLAYYRQSESLKAIPLFRIDSARSTGCYPATASARALLFLHRAVGGCSEHAGTALGAGIGPAQLSVCALDRGSSGTADKS
jgi:tetratricopeptide (TPR) repeat protein